VGTVGHDPWWKKGEAYGFGIIYHFYTTHTWLIPIDAGAPFMEKPPLYYWTSVILCHLLNGILPLHDAARLASSFYMIITAVFTWKSARVLFRESSQSEVMSKITLCLLLGTYGLVRYAHAMMTDVALLAGTAVAFYGMALLCAWPEHWKQSGFWLGIGVGIAFMAKGLVLPAILGLSIFFLWCLLPQLHSRKTFWVMIAAFIVASPFLFVWPYLLYDYSPILFKEWFWENNIGRFLGFSVSKLGAENRPLFFLWMTPVFAFPIFPLACTQIYCGRKQWRHYSYLLPLIFSVTGMAVLLFSASGRSPYLLPLFIAFAPLATQGLIRIPTTILAGWNVFARIAITLSVIITWLIWLLLMQPIADRPLAWLPALFDKWLPVAFVYPESQWLACLVAIIITLFWVASFTLESRSAYSVARTWFLGAALIWCTIHTLLSPWINETRSFRTVLTQLVQYLEASPYANSCIGNYKLGENIAPMLVYFTHKTLPLMNDDVNETACPLLLTFADKEISSEIGGHWEMIWRGVGFLDIRGMELRLYMRGQ